MGIRKVSRQNSLKEVAKNEKKQLNHLIKVLRPKVYITDSSNFKRLVQQLTGNNGSSSSLPLPLPLPSQSPHHQRRPEVVVHIEDIVEPQRQSNCSSEEATSVDSFDQLYNNVNTLEGLLEAELNETRTFDASSMNQHWDWDCLEIESWLLDADHQAFPNLNGFVQNHHDQEVSVYDYDELSWPWTKMN
ncbi:hypothetical protein ACOSP7_000296 [Xanthoceras sorbifolium]